MKALWWGLGLVFLGIPAAIGAFAAYLYVYEYFHTYDYNMCRTVEVETPSGLRSASSVIGYRFQMPPKVAFFSNASREVKGEAVFIDLGPGPDGAPLHVIALLATGPTAQNGDVISVMPERLIGEKRHPYNATDPRNRVMFEALTKSRDSLELAPDWHPTLVTFTDLSDPASAKVIYAQGRKYDCVPPIVINPNCQPRDLGPDVTDRFVETLGAGYALKGVFIQMTSDPVTNGIEGKLPWWGKPVPWLKAIGNGAYVDTRPTDQLRLGPEHFKKGI